METKEITFSGFKMNGFVMLLIHLLVLPAIIALGFWYCTTVTCIISALLCLTWFILLLGYIQLEPNEARIMIFFGKYQGTFKETGFFWVNPFLDKKKLSLRARNLDVEPIKVNDKIGNPILIGLVLVWKLKDTYKAMRVYSLYGFDMFERFVKERPHIIGLLECFVTCKTNEDGQCTYACHYYDKEKGCMLDAAK